MALIRRKTRSVLMAELRLGAMNVRSHTAGSVTVAVRKRAPYLTEEQLQRKVAEVVRSTGITPLLVRSGEKAGSGAQGTMLWVTYTSQEMAEEGAERYGNRALLEWIAAGAVPITAEVVAVASSSEEQVDSVPALEEVVMDGGEIGEEEEYAVALGGELAGAGVEVVEASER